jgi:hypothetical protein
MHASRVRFAILSSLRIPIHMSEHHHEGHFPEEAEENAIGGPVLFALMCVGAAVLVIWALS